MVVEKEVVREVPVEKQVRHVTVSHVTVSHATGRKSRYLAAISKRPFSARPSESLRARPSRSEPVRVAPNRCVSLEVFALCARARVHACGEGRRCCAGRGGSEMRDSDSRETRMVDRLGW